MYIVEIYRVNLFGKKIETIEWSLFETQELAQEFHDRVYQEFKHMRGNLRLGMYAA